MNKMTYRLQYYIFGKLIRKTICFGEIVRKMHYCLNVIFVVIGGNVRYKRFQQALNRFKGQ